MHAREDGITALEWKQPALPVFSITGQEISQESRLDVTGDAHLRITIRTPRSCC